jgi:plasmid stabilization system protein ParE
LGTGSIGNAATGFEVKRQKLQIFVTAQAERELEAMLAWLSERNPKAAQKAELDVSRAIDLAALFPMANRAAKSELERIKSLPKWHKVIIYKVEAERIIVLSIRDTRQLPQS